MGSYKNDRGFEEQNYFRVFSSHLVENMDDGVKCQYQF